MVLLLWIIVGLSGVAMLVGKIYCFAMNEVELFFNLHAF